MDIRSIKQAGQERRYYVALATIYDLRGRFLALESECRSEALRRAFDEYEAIRKWGTELDELRAVHQAVSSMLETAEKASIEGRIRRTLVDAPKKRRKMRRYISLGESRKNFGKDKPQKGKSKKEKNHREERRQSKVA